MRFLPKLLATAGTGPAKRVAGLDILDNLLLHELHLLLVHQTPARLVVHLNPIKVRNILYFLLIVLDLTLS